MVSSYRESSIKRRDERHTKRDIRPPPGNKKDTKKWCRGVIGREHTPQCVSFAEHRRAPWARPHWRILICSECKKELDRYWPIPYLSVVKEIPKWVV